MDTPYTFEPDSVDIKARTDAAIEDAKEKTFGSEAVAVAVERKSAIRGGSYTLGRKDYWIPEPLYSEVLARDEATPMGHRGNKEFGRWLNEFVKEHDIKPDEKKNTRSLSGYWAMPYSYNVDNKFADDPGTKHTVKMASVLRAMKSVVSVVDPKHKLNVIYNPKGSTSAWDTGSQVLLPVEPIDRVIDLEDCINVMGGFSIHEAWHSQYTREILDEVGLKFVTDDQWNAWIMNLIEDERIEFNGLKETPGYTEYLNYTKEYMWSEKGLPIEWPTDPVERFRIAIGLIRYRDRIDELFTDPSFVEPREWLRDWSLRYSEAQGNGPTSENMIDFVNEGRKFFEITLDTPSPSPKEMMLACAAIEGDKGISGSGAERIDKAIEEEVEGAGIGSALWAKIFGKPGKTAGYGTTMSSVVVRRPKTSGRYKASRGDLIEKAKAALVLRKTQPQHDTRLQAQGILDEDELYRLFARDVRVFKDATIESLPSAAVYMLVDMSGSMGTVEDRGYPAYYAVKMAQLMVEGLSKNPNVRLKVLGHSGQNSDNREGGSFYRIWEPGDSMDRLSILADHSLYAQNFDGWAIAWAGKMLQEENVDQKLLIVLADGIPGAGGYGGVPAMAHVREMSDRLLRSGVNVVQVAIGGGLYESDQAAMFKHYIAVDTAGSEGDAMFSVILRKLTKLLQKVI